MKENRWAFSTSQLSFPRFKSPSASGLNIFDWRMDGQCRAIGKSHRKCAQAVRMSKRQRKRLHRAKPSLSPTAFRTNRMAASVTSVVKNIARGRKGVRRPFQKRTLVAPKTSLGQCESVPWSMQRRTLYHHVQGEG